MKKVIAISTLVITLLSLSSFQSYLTYEHAGEGPSELSYDVSSWGDTAVFELDARTFMDASSIKVEDEAGNVLARFISVGIVYWDKKKNIDLSTIEGDTLFVRITGRRTKYTYSLYPSHQSSTAQ